MDPLELPGVWTFSRSVEDRLGEDFTVAGTAEFTMVDGRIRWFESGDMLRGGTSIPVNRTLFLVPTSEGQSRWSVTFEDGRFFHPWPDFTETTQRDMGGEDGPGHVVHLCTPDLYRGHVDFSDGEGWSLRWDVAGPHKDYTMTTRYRRV